MLGGLGVPGQVGQAGIPVGIQINAETVLPNMQGKVEAIPQSLF